MRQNIRKIKIMEINKKKTINEQKLNKKEVYRFCLN